MKKLCCKFSIIIPLAMIFTLLMDSITISIVELGIYLGYNLTTFLFIAATVVWLCCSSFRKNCCNGTWTETLFNLVPVEVLSALVFAQWHFRIFIGLSMLFAVTEGTFMVSLRKSEAKHRHSKRVHRLYKDVSRKFMVLSLATIYMIPCLLTVFIYDFHAPTYTADEDVWNRLISDASGVESKKEAPWDAYRENLALLLCFEYDCWSKYTINEKITIMQKLVDFEADCLGIPTIPITTELLSGFTLGQYSNEAKEIWIDIEHLAKSPVEECIQTICHEIFHSYQHYLVDNLDWDSDVLQCSYFTELHVWKENQENYRSVWTSGYDAYESQPLEITARSYAEQETEKILSYIS